MDHILSEVLSWGNTLSNNKKIRYDLEKMSNNFKTILNYKNSFEGLFFEELRCQIDKILEGNLNKEKILLGKILWKEVRKKTLVIMVQLSNNLKHDLSERSLVIILLKKIDGKKTKFKRYFGIVFEKTKQKKLLIQINYAYWKDYTENEDLIQIIDIKQTFRFMELTKEINALNSMKDIHVKLKNIILMPQLNYINRRKINISLPYKNHLLVHFNLSQIKAIGSSFKNHITLIQGPPGTGKTKTILGIISIINIIRKNTISGVFGPKITPEKVIICAPSNAAIDENVIRSTEGYLSNLNFKKKWPLNMIRLGPNYNPGLDHISLENISLLKE